MEKKTTSNYKAFMLNKDMIQSIYKEKGKA